VVSSIKERTVFTPKIMLVISRNINQSILIGDDIKVSIVDIRGERIRLGIEAPNNVSIHRQEVYEVLQAKGIPEKDELPSGGMK
jgi:carbon storage regulator